MEFSHLFEDLEAQFAAANDEPRSAEQPLDCLPAGPVLVEIMLAEGSLLKLIAPTLGIDFLAGISLETGAITAISLRTAGSITITQVRPDVSFELKKTGRELAEFSQLFIENKFLVYVHFDSRLMPAKKGWLVGQALTLVKFVDSKSLKSEFFAIATISRIECCSVHN